MVVIKTMKQMKKKKKTKTKNRPLTTHVKRGKKKE